MADRPLNAKGHLAKIIDAWLPSKGRRSYHGVEMEHVITAADETLCEKYELAKSRGRFVQLVEKNLAYQDPTCEYGQLHEGGKCDCDEDCPVCLRANIDCNCDWDEEE